MDAEVISVNIGIESMIQVIEDNNVERTLNGICSLMHDRGYSVDAYERQLICGLHEAVENFNRYFKDGRGIKVTY